MDIFGVMYLVMGLTFGVSILVVVGVIAGKDIMFAFLRRFSPRGCDVYLANQTRIISSYFKTPKDGVFRLKGLPYLTNPEKVMNLTSDEKKSAMDSLTKREARLKSRIKELDSKILQLKAMKDASKDQTQKFQLQSQIEHFTGVKTEINDKLRLKQENYFKDKRPAFFYIEGDPIPKDFYEFYSALDCTMVDNLVSRSITTQPTAKMDMNIKTMKMILWGAAIACGIAAFYSFQNNGFIVAICNQVGATCS